MNGWSMSDPGTEVCAAYVAALAELSELPKTEKAKVPTKDGGSYSYTYAGLDSVLPAVRPILARHDLAAFHSASSAQGVVCVSVTIMHKSGQWISFDPLCLASGSSPQSAGSALTYARRYTLLPALGIATEDDDGAAAMQGQPPDHQATTANRPQPEPTYRTVAEARIREMLAGLNGNEASKVQTAFREQFGKPLSKLERERHDEALTFVEFLLAPATAAAAGDGDG